MDARGKERTKQRMDEESKGWRMVVWRDRGTFSLKYSTLLQKTSLRIAGLWWWWVEEALTLSTPRILCGFIF
jgi:hypothetical protein